VATDYVGRQDLMGPKRKHQRPCDIHMSCSSCPNAKPCCIPFLQSLQHWAAVPRDVLIVWMLLQAALRGEVDPGDVRDAVSVAQPASLRGD
jgi:hypothetical protein